jgi:hypothetical protein
MKKSKKFSNIAARLKLKKLVFFIIFAEVDFVFIQQFSALSNVSG